MAKAKQAPVTGEKPQLIARMRRVMERLVVNDVPDVEARLLERLEVLYSKTPRGSAEARRLLGLRLALLNGAQPKVSRPLLLPAMVEPAPPPVLMPPAPPPPPELPVGAVSSISLEDAARMLFMSAPEEVEPSPEATAADTFDPFADAEPAAPSGPVLAFPDFTAVFAEAEPEAEPEDTFFDPRPIPAPSSQIEEAELVPDGTPAPPKPKAKPAGLKLDFSGFDQLDGAASGDGASRPDDDFWGADDKPQG